MLSLGHAMKLLGSILVITASVGLAFQIRADLQRHMDLLYELRRLFLAISYEESYSLQPAEQLFLQESLTGDSNLKEILESIAARLTKNSTAAAQIIWQEEFEKKKDALGLSAEEIDIINGAGSAFFGKSIEENKRQLSLVLERLDFLIEQTRGEQKEKQKVYQTLSIVCGFMLIILFL